MLKKVISYLVLITAFVLLEEKIIPGFITQVRVDIFIGVVLGFVIYGSLPYSLMIIIITSFVLQAFTGAPFGCLPVAYTLAYLVFDAIEGFVYLENIPAQFISGFLFFMLFSVLCSFIFKANLSGNSFLLISLNALFTGLVCPVAVFMTRMIWKTDER